MMESEIEVKEYEQVELIASGYEWICPHCEAFNAEIEVTEQVTCRSCRFTFEVEDYYHAIG